jgi:hypothetical protein
MSSARNSETYKSGTKMDTKQIEKTIHELENKLLQPEIRNSPAEVAKLLNQDFVEYCSPGTIYKYKTNDCFPSPGIDFRIYDFAVKMLADDIVLATFKLIKHSEPDESKKYSLRSSIWQLVDGNWKMIFHQGTLTKKFV